MKAGNASTLDQSALLRAFAEAPATGLKDAGGKPAANNDVGVKKTPSETDDAVRHLPAIVSPAALQTTFENVAQSKQGQAKGLTGAGYGEASSQSTQGARVTSLVAFRMATFPPKGGVAHLGHPPPTTETVQDNLDQLLSQSTFEKKHGGSLKLEDFQTDTEAYFGVFYDDNKGDLAVRKLVTGSSNDDIAMSAGRLQDAAQPGETIVGGFHNHPDGAGEAASKADMGSANILAREFAGYQDFVLVGQSEDARLLPIDSTKVDIVGLDKDRLHYSSVFKMNREIRTGKKGTEGMSRADKAHSAYGQDHVHFSSDNSAVNKDGSVKEGAPYGQMSSKNKKWLRGWNFNV